MPQKITQNMKYKTEKDLYIGTKGIFLIDKPTGVSSHAVVNKVRKITGIKRVGHTGTLDPLATGLLIILVGREYTKLQSHFLKQDKEYICQAKLGLETDSYDIDGKIINQKNWNEIKQINKKKIVDILDKFRGEIKQTVPAFSAVKVKGQKLYQKARQGLIKKSDLPQRAVNIKTLQLIKFNLDQKKEDAYFTIRVECSSGTYIRSLVNDIGEEMRIGATVANLRRIKIGTIDLES